MGQAVKEITESRRFGAPAPHGRRTSQSQSAQYGGTAEALIGLVAGQPPAVEEHTGRRLLNIVVAVIGLILAAPLLLVIAVAVKLTSRGPVFYTQTRVGLDQRNPGVGDDNRRRVKDIGGKPFRIYKFRTMHVDAEASGNAVWATPSDPRLTPVGGFLRQYRLDELPQLLNVLKGDMNIVGPRPERPQLFETLRQDVADYQYRQRAKPGITGLAQINQQYDASLDDVRQKVLYDLDYLRRRSLATDIKIMIKTVPVVLFRRGGW